jgi:SNF2 family DNA or RNA helicase
VETLARILSSYRTLDPLRLSISLEIVSRRSSTLENWCREFARFAPSISVQTFYAGKEERANLRQMLIDTQRGSNKNGAGWEVLITTYNLAQGDDRDRKFFRKMQWDVSQTTCPVMFEFFTCGPDYRFRRGARLEELPVPALSGLTQI